MHYMTIHEVASTMKVSQVTVRRWVWTGKLPATRVGRILRVKSTDLERLTQSATVQQPTRGAVARPGFPAAILAASRKCSKLVTRRDVERLERLIEEGCEGPGQTEDDLG